MARRFKSPFAVRAAFFYVVALHLGYSENESKSLALMASRECGQNDGGYRGGMGYRLGVVSPLSRPSTSGMKRMGSGLCYEMPFCGMSAHITPAEKVDEIRAFFAGKKQKPSEFDKKVTSALGSGFLPLVRQIESAVQKSEDLDSDALHILKVEKWK